MNQQEVMEPPPHSIQLPQSLQFDPLQTHAPEMKIVKILENRAILIQNFLTTNECSQLVEFIESRCYESQSSDEIVMVAANSKLSYRNNLRMMGISEQISQILYERLLFILQQIGEDCITCDETNSDHFLHNGFGMIGTWRLDSLNPCFRLCKYNPSGHFGPHYDSDYVVDPINHRSLKTFMIYLNPCRGAVDDPNIDLDGGYLGGQTNFCHSHDMFYDKEREIYCSPSDAIYNSVSANIGDCLVFDHHILHEGAQVLRGYKYLMRSDVMYRKSLEISEVITEEILQKERRKEEAIRIYYEGMKLEENGDIDGGIALYRRAYKLCPELEECMT